MTNQQRKAYPDGVPQTVDVDPTLSLRDLFERACRRYADRPAFSNLGTLIDYRRLDALSRDLAAYLQNRAGLVKGDRVALMLPNLLQYPVAFFAAQRAGLTVVNVNPLYTADELLFQLRDSGAQAIVLLENFSAALQSALTGLALRCIIVSRAGDLLGPVKGTLVSAVARYRGRATPPARLPGAQRFRAALAAGADLTLKRVPLDGNDIALLQYTGGTTGAAKAAVLTHHNLVANIHQLAAWIGIVARPGREVVVTALPLYHIFSLTANCLLFSHLGCHNLLITDPRDRAAFVRELKRFRWTAITGVDTLFNALLHSPGFADLDFSALHMSLGGGMAIQPQVAERWRQVTGTTLIQAYGLTEASPGVCITPMNATTFCGSVGPPLPSTEVVIRDPLGKDLAAGQDGEVWIRGPQVMQRYWRNDPESNAVRDADGWLRTGDIGHLDAAGYLYLVDRIKDLILVSGFNVYPHEVESVALTHPAICEAAAVGIADPNSGQRVKLFVVTEPAAGATVDAAAVVAFCREHLAGYKVPRRVEFREQLPKSNVGKVLRRKLREPAQSH